MKKLGVWGFYSRFEIVYFVTTVDPFVCVCNPMSCWGAVVAWCQTVNRGDGGSIPPTSVSKLRQFRSPHICLCLSEETLNAGGSFYLVSMPGEAKDPT